MSTLDLTANIIDVRDIIERFEELESELGQEHEEQNTTLSFEYWLQDTANTLTHKDEMQEFNTMQSILEELKGYGGDVQWHSDWYPCILIADEYFTEYAEDLVKDCEGLPREIPSYIEIDWEATADNIKIDYSTIEIDGNEYWYR